MGNQSSYAGSVESYAGSMGTYVGNVGTKMSTYVGTWMGWTPNLQGPDVDLSHKPPKEVMSLLAQIPYENAAHVTSVNLADCDLAEIPDSVLKLTALEDIELSWNKLTDVSKLGSLPQLSSINCTGNPLVALPTTLKQLHDLEVLTVCQTSLFVVQDEVSTLPKLRELSLFSNKLTSLAPLCLAQATSLTELNVSVNKLQQLPENLFANTPLLQKFAAHSNILNALPAIAHLGKLEDLKANRNRLQVFPRLGTHVALKEIDLSTNQIQVLPRELFSRETLPSLVKLELASNKLTSIPDTIVTLPSLSYLGLGNNQLKELPPQVYHMTTLVHLNLCRNQFAGFPNDLLFLQYSLESLYLSHNQLTTLPPFLSYFMKLRAFSITGNKLQLNDGVVLEAYRSVQFIVRDRNKGQWMGMEDEVLEDEYWKTVWGPYDTEWQGLFPT